MRGFLISILLLVQLAASNPISKKNNIHSISRRETEETIHETILQKHKTITLDASSKNRTDLIHLPKAGLYYVEFSDGRVYWSPDNGAYALMFEVWRTYKYMESANTTLGHPLAYLAFDEDYEGRWAIYQQFQYGRYYLEDVTPAGYLYGSIYEKWLALGGAKEVGFPEDYQRCEQYTEIKRCHAYFREKSSVLYWTPASGAIMMRGSFQALLNFYYPMDAGWDFPLYPLTEEISTPDTWDQPGRYQIVWHGEDYQSREPEIVFFGNPDEPELAVLGGSVWKRYKELGGVDGYLQRPLLTSDWNALHTWTLDFVGGRIYHSMNTNTTFDAPGPLPEQLAWSAQINQDGMTGGYSVQVDQGGDVQINATFTRLRGAPYAVACAIIDGDGVTRVFGKIVNATDESDAGTQVDSSTKSGRSSDVISGFRALDFAEPIQCVAKENGDLIQVGEDAVSKVGGTLYPYWPEFGWLIEEED